MVEEQQNDAMNEGQPQTQEAQPQEQASPAESEAPAAEGSNNKMVAGAVAVVLIVAVIGAALWYFGVFGSGGTGDAPEGAVAIVNGEEIPAEDYNAQIENLEAQGQQVGEAQREQLVNGLVERQLVLQYAQENNISASSDDVDEQYEQFVAQFGGEEQMDTFLEEQSITKEQVREDIETQLTIQAVLETQTEGVEFEEITAEDVEARYDELVAGAEGEDAPSLEEAEPQVRAQLEQEQQGEVYEEFIAQLREDAEIEILI